MEYDVLCKIFQSATNRPLFECVITEVLSLKAQSIATNPTTVVKKVLQAAVIKISFKNGNCFFGLDRPEVLKMKGKENKTNEGTLQGSLTAATASSRQAASCDVLFKPFCWFMICADRGEST